MPLKRILRKAKRGTRAVGKAGVGVGKGLTAAGFGGVGRRVTAGGRAARALGRGQGVKAATHTRRLR